MNLKRNEEQITENQLFATHNLEVPGSSPGWSTKKIPNRLLFNSLLGIFFICVNRMSTKLLTIRFYLTYATVNN